MYFKVDTNSKLHHDLKVLFSRKHEAQAVANAFIDKLNQQLGDTDTRYYGVSNFLGGFSAKIFKDKSKIPASWRRTPYDHNAATPSNSKKYAKENEGILKEIDALPKIGKSEFSAILNYGAYDGEVNGQIQLSYTPTIQNGRQILVKTPGFVTLKKYTPVDGMIEITASEYEAIREENIKIAEDEKQSKS